MSQCKVAKYFTSGTVPLKAPQFSATPFYGKGASQSGFSEFLASIPHFFAKDPKSYFRVTGHQDEIDINSTLYLVHLEPYHCAIHYEVQIK